MPVISGGVVLGVDHGVALARNDVLRRGRVYKTRVLKPPVITSGGVLPPRVFRRDYHRRGSVFYERPPLKSPPAAVAGKYLRPLVVRSDARRGALAYRTRLPLKPSPAPVAGPAPRPRVVRSDFRRGGRVFRLIPPGPTVQSLSANRVPPPRVLRRDYRRGAFVYGTRVLPATPIARPGKRIELKSGPLATIPVLRFAEPAFTSDSKQVFLGDGYANHLQVSMEAVPATSGSVGYPGQIATDGTYLYICIAANSWKRISLTSF